MLDRWGTPAWGSPWTVVGRRHLQRVLGAYTEHYNKARPHRSLDLQPPDPGRVVEARAGTNIRRRDVLGGLIHEYERRAA
jgi:putative transposase